MKTSIALIALVAFSVFVAIAAKPLPNGKRIPEGTSFCTAAESGKFWEAGHGITFTTNEDTILISQNIRADSVRVTPGQTSVAVTFDTPLPDSDYVLTIVPSEFAQVRWSNKTATGFTLNLLAGINGKVDYLATPIP